MLYKTILKSRLPLIYLFRSLEYNTECPIKMATKIDKYTNCVSDILKLQQPMDNLVEIN